MQLPRLFWRLCCCLVIGTTCLALALAWFAQANAARLREQAQRIQLESIGQGFVAQLSRHLHESTAETTQKFIKQQLGQQQVRVMVIDTKGELLADSTVNELPQQSIELTQRADFRLVLSGEVPVLYRREQIASEATISLILPIQLQGKIAAVLRLSQLESEFANLPGWPIWWIAALSWLLVNLLCIALLYYQFRPLELLANTAEQLARGQPLGKAQVQQTHELNQLSLGLETLYRRLEEDSLTMGRRGSEQAAILGSMVEGVLAVDSDERIITLNRAAASLTEIPAHEAPGKSLQAVLRNADLRRFVLNALVSLDSIQDDIIMHGERDRVLQVRGTALRDRQGRPIGAVIVLNDVTHTRHLENIRRDFVAYVSHELKTPIASIKGFVETLLDGAMHDPSDAERFLRIVVKQADRLDTIIEDLLSLSKIEQSEEASNLPVEQQFLLPILEAVLHDCETKANDRQVNVQLTCSDTLECAVNARLLEQALVNLVDNALKYSEAGQQVEIRAQTDQHGVVIAVQDHGPGIEKEHLPRLFERFYRVDKARSRKLGGTGLGLAIVKHIVLAHRGRIDVISQPGQGSTFSIHLPQRVES